LPPIRPELLLHIPTITEAIVESLFFINFFWGLINLLPVWPLDGGQISREFFAWLSPHNGERIALGISLVVSGLVAIHGLMLRFGKPLIPVLTNLDGLFLAIMFGLLAIGSFQQLQQLSQQPWREDWPSRSDRDRWEHDEWKR
jgi:stage IV sporulation protein FB